MSRLFVPLTEKPDLITSLIRNTVDNREKELAFDLTTLSLAKEARTLYA